MLLCLILLSSLHECHLLRALTGPGLRCRQDAVNETNRRAQEGMRARCISCVRCVAGVALRYCSDDAMSPMLLALIH